MKFLSRVAEKLKETAMKSRTYYLYYNKLPRASNDTTPRIFLPPKHDDNFNLNLSK